MADPNPIDAQPAKFANLDSDVTELTDAEAEVAAGGLLSLGKSFISRLEPGEIRNHTYQAIPEGFFE